MKKLVAIIAIFIISLAFVLAAFADTPKNRKNSDDGYIPQKAILFTPDQITADPSSPQATIIEEVRIKDGKILIEIRQNFALEILKSAENM